MKQRKELFVLLHAFFLLKYKVHKGKHENHNISINKSHFANTEETHTDTKKSKRHPTKLITKLHNVYFITYAQIHVLAKIQA